jgi:hypothetical protein
MKTLSFEQMEVINAGLPEWLVKAWNAVCDFFVDAWCLFLDWVYSFIPIDWDEPWPLPED